MLYHSAELRWFWAGDIPGAVYDWYGTSTLGSPEERTDDYLRLPGWESVGVKRRGPSGSRKGSFEVKAIKGIPEIMRLGARIQGRSDIWVKWSDNAESLQDWLRNPTTGNQTWLSVSKSRWIRKISLDGRGTPIEIPRTTYPAQGSTVELARVTVHGHPHWTFALEGFGPASTVRHNLLQAATWFFDENPAVFDFELSNSQSYPTWLNTIM